MPFVFSNFHDFAELRRSLRDRTETDNRQDSFAPRISLVASQIPSAFPFLILPLFPISFSVTSLVMLRATVSRPSSGQLGRMYRHSRTMSTAVSSVLLRGRSNFAPRSNRKLPAVIASTSHRGYAMAVEDTNKGVVGPGLWRAT